MNLYRIRNLDKSTVIASEAELAATSWTRLKGLLGRTAREFPPGKGLWIIPSQGVHTIGMRFPIDVIYLDSKRRVIHVCRRLRPNRIAALKLRADSVIELPPGMLDETGTAVGDTIGIDRVAEVQDAA